MNYITKLIQVFTKAPTYFEKIKKQHLNYSKAYIFYLLFASIPFLLSVFQIYIEHFSSPMFIITISISVFMVFMAPFIYSGIVHAGVLVFGKKSGFLKTFNAVTRSLPVGMVYTFIVTLLSLAVLLVNDFIAFTSLILTSIISLVSLAHVLYTEIVGISKMHDLSLGRSALSVIIPYTISVLIIFLSIFIYVLILFS